MALRKKTKEAKKVRRCCCGCNRIINGSDVVKTVCAIDYVKKLGYSVSYLIFNKPLTPKQLKIKREIERYGE